MPLTERILARLPGPRVLWIVAWALVPWANAGANVLLDIDGTSAVWEQSTALVILNYVALSFAAALTVWGTGRLAARLESLGAAEGASAGVNSAAGPLLVSAAGALVLGAAAFERDGWTAALLRGGTWFVLGIALWGFLWTYVWLQLGLGRLVREHVLPDAAPVDPSLGLRPYGSAAFTGLWMLLVWLVPVLLTGLPDLAGVVLGLLVLVGALGLFFLALVRLHRQMVAVKERELATARELYSQAYGPVRAAPTLDTLERQQSHLSAADSLEKRAQAIHEWPIDETTFAWVITITTSVVAMTIGRLILSPLGL